MTTIQYLLDRFASNVNGVAIESESDIATYGNIISDYERALTAFNAVGLEAGDMVMLRGDYSRIAIASLLALATMKCISIPLTDETYKSVQSSLDELSADWIIFANSSFKIERLKSFGEKPSLCKKLIDSNAAGLILYTSGSSGKPKAVLHNFESLLKKFENPRPTLKTINFLLFDHWGGLNTLFHSLSNISTLIFPKYRDAYSICELVERHQIELLPTTPSFLSLLLASKAYLNYNLNSLKVISYGAEPMHQDLLLRIRGLFPAIDFRQTYGMIEIGVLRAKSKGPNSTWLKVGGDEFSVRVVDGMLEVKSESAMMGYINAPSPFTVDGYMKTGDRVEQDGDWIRIIGRDSEIINVGGQKVFPAEVELKIMEVPGVLDVLVYGDRHKLLGKIVCADIYPSSGVDRPTLKSKILRHCKENLQAYMVPMKISFCTEPIQNSRQKKDRGKYSIQA
jgi:acyl-coenzyme A synthetase/AMP-(fatty) acid ligase